MTDRRLEDLSINTIRTLSIDAVEKADSGHPGLPLDAAPMAYVLWQKYLRHNPKDIHWPDRDRFVLSAGHGSMLLYSLLYLTGYESVTLDQIKSFRQWGSCTPGHPESFKTPGVEATTGPLGQGQANAVGMAIAERALAHRFNRPGHTIVDHYTYSLVSDGDMMEGISYEACSLAGFLKLGKLIFFYDSNETSLSGPTSLVFSHEDIARRFRSQGWEVFDVERGDTDIEAIDAAIARSRQNLTQPSLIIVHTTTGYGSPHKAGTYQAHGEPLGEEEVKLTKQALHWDPSKKFHVPDEVLTHFRSAIDRGCQAQQEWQDHFDAWAKKFPDLAEEWHRAFSNKLPQNWDDQMPTWDAGEMLATRNASGEAINAIALRVPELIGGDADLFTSTKTYIKNTGDFEGQNGSGRNIHFGIKEHSMAAITSGIAYHGGMRPFCATFFVFSDYMRPAIRLASMARLPVIYVWTHDSIGLGEDGPTHQPIEHLISLRAMPNMTVIRPADANEAAEAWRYAMENPEGPVGMVLTRQKLPVIDRNRCAAATGLHRGAYVLSDPEGYSEAIIIATGSEVHLALEAQERLKEDDILVRVVSMPSWEIFAKQPQEYRESVLPPSVTARVSVEAAATYGWERWIGSCGKAIGIDRYGSSSPGATNMQRFGFTVENIARQVRELVEKAVEVH